MIAQAEVGAAEAAQRQARFPVGAAVEFEDLERADRVDVFDRLRATEPVSWVPAMGGWLVTSYALARQVLGPRSAFTVQAHENLVRASLGQMMLTTDPPEHEHMRAPFEAPFHRRAVEQRFREPVTARVGQLLDRLQPQGSCDLASEFAAPFAIGVAGDMLGLSLDDVPRIRGFYDAFAGGMVYDGDPEPQRRADAARAEFSELLMGELERTRRAPDASVTSAVVADSATKLSDDEVVAQLRVILFGAIETIESMVLNTVMLLLDHPAQLEAVRADAELIPNSAAGSLRLELRGVIEQQHDSVQHHRLDRFDRAEQDHPKLGDHLVIRKLGGRVRYHRRRDRGVGSATGTLELAHQQLAELGPGGVRPALRLGVAVVHHASGESVIEPADPRHVVERQTQHVSRHPDRKRCRELRRQITAALRRSRSSSCPTRAVTGSRNRCSTARR